MAKRIARKGPCHVGIDLMGSDLPPRELLQAIVAYHAKLKKAVQLTLIATPQVLKGLPRPPSGLFLHTAKEVITMEDDPIRAVRRKKDSTLCAGIHMIHAGRLQAFVSAGNTGALMCAAKLTLSTVPGIDRPALLTLLPTQKKEVAVLDVGANVACRAKHLVQFAKMGVAYQKSRGIKTPVVGLLNIGTEAQKGTPELKETYDQLQRLAKGKSFRFQGNIEGRHVFQGEIDVLVTDGFTGNVFLKTAEGMASFILEQIVSSAKEASAPHLKGLLSELGHRLDYTQYPGALLAGVNGIVIKCHGTTSIQSVLCSITGAIRLVEHDFLSHLHS